MEMTFISVLRPHTYVTLLEDSVMRQRLQLFIVCVPRMQIVSTVAKSRYQTTTKSLEHATTLSLRLSRKHQQQLISFFLIRDVTRLGTFPHELAVVEGGQVIVYCLHVS